MKIFNVNSKNLGRVLKDIEKKNSSFDPKLVSATEKIVEDVRINGDAALFKYSKRFDKAELNKNTIKVSPKEFEDAERKVSKQLLKDLKIAAARIKDYQKKKMPKGKTYKDSLGNELGWIIRPIEKVGIYVPGGKAAYPSSVLMTAIPARVAGVEKVYVTTPCNNGNINPLVLAAAKIAGVDAVFKAGGAQAVSALAFGTESITRVDKIVGPGNIYVAIAKKLVFGSCDIDMIAGPSEVLVIADGSCSPDWVAADLLAQAEHDEMAVATLVTTSGDFAGEVKKEVKRQLNELKRKKIASDSIKNNGKIFVVENMNQALQISNAVAPEHLELCVKSPKSLINSIKHAGAVFLGSMSTEPFGDYVSGPSHVLPTGGAAKFSSPLSVYDFIKMPSTISISKNGFKVLGDTVMNLAYSEGLEAHALSVKRRLNN
ncbi:MAG: histidinol dehydrogenase [Thermodesulfobacteriota bacterium]